MRISKQHMLGVLAFAVCAAAPASAAEFSTERSLGTLAENERVIWQRFSRVVFDGESYVALWEADRANFAPFYGGWLYAARVSEDGTLLDAHGILVARGLSIGSSAATRAPWGTLVVYPSGDGVVRARVSRSGELAESIPLVIGDSLDVYPYPSAACLEFGCFVLYSAGSNTKGVALDGCGERVPGTELALTKGEWAVRASGDEYVAFGRVPPQGAAAELQAVGLTPDGGRTFGPVPLPVPGETTLAFGADSMGSLVVWSVPMENRLHAICLDRDGRVIGENEVLASTDALAVGGLDNERDHYRLGIRVGTTAATLAIDRCGRPLDASPVALAGDESSCTVGAAHVASGSRSAFAVWDYGLNAGDCDVPPGTAALLASGSGAVRGAVDVQGAVARMGPPSIGTDGTHYLVAWHEDREGAEGLYTQALRADGEPIEEPVLTIGAAAHFVAARTASVHFVGGRYVVELHAHDDTLREGWDEPNVAAEIDPRTLLRGGPRLQPALGVPGATTFLEAEAAPYLRGEDMPTFSVLTIRATDASHTVLGSEWRREIPYREESDGSPRVAFDGQNFGVVWKRLQYDAPGGIVGGDLLFMSFDEEARPLLSEPVVLPGPFGEFEPATLTFGAGVHLLGLLAPDASMAAVRVSPQGELLDTEPKVLLNAPVGNVERRLVGSAFDGEAFVLAWSERSIGGAAVPGSSHTDFDVRAAWVTPEALSVTEGSIASSREDEIGSAGLASTGNGVALVGYHRFDEDGLGWRAFVRTLGSGVCATHEACSDDACDGTCCTRGCTTNAIPLACELADCGAGCAENEHCVEGLGCVPDAVKPRPRVVRTDGCGCRTTEPRGWGAWALVSLVAAVALGWRRFQPRRWT